MMAVNRGDAGAGRLCRRAPSRIVLAIRFQPRVRCIGHRKGARITRGLCRRLLGHPLFLFNEHGDCVAAHAAASATCIALDDWDDLLVPEIEQTTGGGYFHWRSARTLRSRSRRSTDALVLKSTWTMPSACRQNKNPELEIADILFQSRRDARDCTPLVRYKSFRYQAQSWFTPRRIVAKVEHHRHELLPRVSGLIVTNMTIPSRSVERLYNIRGTAEQCLQEGKQATHWTRLSCLRFRANEVRLQLSVLAYNLGNIWRRLSPAASDQTLGRARMLQQRMVMSTFKMPLTAGSRLGPETPR